MTQPRTARRHQRARRRARPRPGIPWIYKSDVADVIARGGDTVVVRNPRGRIVGRALFSDRSQIALRMLDRWARRRPGIDLWRARLEAAIAFRASLGIDATAYRLVHAEGDLLPSFIVDRYGDYVVIQALSQGVDRLVPQLVDDPRRPAAARRHPRAQRRARAPARRPRVRGDAAARRGAADRDRARGPDRARGGSLARPEDRPVPRPAREPRRRRGRTPAAGCSTASATTARSRCSWPTGASRRSRSTCRRRPSATSRATPRATASTNIEARCGERVRRAAADGARRRAVRHDRARPAGVREEQGRRREGLRRATRRSTCAR